MRSFINEGIVSIRAWRAVMRDKCYQVDSIELYPFCTRETNRTLTAFVGMFSAIESEITLNCRLQIETKITTDKSISFIIVRPTNIMYSYTDLYIKCYWNDMHVCIL